MAFDRQNAALQVIFSFFLGLMIVAFIGVGVNTFYPSPYDDVDEELESLYEQERDIESSRGQDGELTTPQEAELEDVRGEIDDIEDSRRETEEIWARNTSIVLILFATLVMGVSLVRSEQLRIISNGLLLGGLFTMIYGVGWVIASGSSVARFAVMTFALAVTVGLGYARFVVDRTSRSATPESASATATIPTRTAEETAELEQRVRTLEKRLDAAASAMRHDRGE